MKLIAGLKAAWKYLGVPYAVIVLLVVTVLVYAIAKAMIGMMVVAGLVLALLARITYDGHDMPMGDEFHAQYDALTPHDRAQADFLRQRNAVSVTHDGADL